MCMVACLQKARDIEGNTVCHFQDVEVQICLSICATCDTYVKRPYNNNNNNNNKKNIAAPAFINKRIAQYAETELIKVGLSQQNDNQVETIRC